MTDQPSQPYRSTPLFTQDSLPQALQREHRTKIGVWGLLCVTEGSIRFVHEDGRPPCIVTPQAPYLIEPDSPHHVELMGPVSLRVDFYDHEPVGRLP